MRAAAASAAATVPPHHINYCLSNTHQFFLCLSCTSPFSYDALRASSVHCCIHSFRGTMLIEDFTVASPNVEYTDEAITSTYQYDSTQLTRTDKGAWVVSPTSTQYQFRVDRRVPKLG